MAFGSFSSLLFWDRRDDLTWIHLDKEASEPNEITVSSSYLPFQGRRPDFKFQEGCLTNTEKTTSTLSFGAKLKKNILRNEDS